jgi:hypothetical protein
MLQDTKIRALEWVLPGCATEEDFNLLLQADEAQPLIDRIPLLQIDHALRQSRMHLFRIKPGPGVILIEKRQAYGVSRLVLLRGAGRAGFQIRSILYLLDKTRQEWGCECIETVVYSDRLKQALEIVGVQTEGFVMTYSGEEEGGDHGR